MFSSHELALLTVDGAAQPFIWFSYIPRDQVLKIMVRTSMMCALHGPNGFGAWAQMTTGSANYLLAST